MPEPLKNLYNEAFFESLTQVLSDVHPPFDEKHFTTLIFDDSWQDKELKQRMRHITECLFQCFPEYDQAIPLLKLAASRFENSFEHMFFPDYVECYGLEFYDISIDALEYFTQYSSSEFAVRPFIIKYPVEMMLQMKHWANHDNEHVRRLASEGCRPRLPWAMQLPSFISNPAPVVEVLEQLKDDESLYVRRSVANNLNDIAKDHSQIVLNIAQTWLGQNKDTDWLIKHACRTLLKQAHPQALELFGFTPASHITIQDFNLTKEVEWAGTLQFSARINSDKPLGKLRIEFAIAFKKANGQNKNKVFKIAESDYKETSKQINKTFSFKAISTRKYYAGEHQLSLIINGETMVMQSFTLKHQ